MAERLLPAAKQYQSERPQLHLTEGNLTRTTVRAARKSLLSKRQFRRTHVHDAARHRLRYLTSTTPLSAYSLGKLACKANRSMAGDDPIEPSKIQHSGASSDRQRAIARVGRTTPSDRRAVSWHIGAHNWLFPTSCLLFLTRHHGSPVVRRALVRNVWSTCLAPYRVGLWVTVRINQCQPSVCASKPRRAPWCSSCRCWTCEEQEDD